jgi:hypothetical protein
MRNCGLVMVYTTLFAVVFDAIGTINLSAIEVPFLSR